MAQAFDAQFIAISAVLGGVRDIREGGRARRACARRFEPAGDHRLRRRGAPLPTRASRTPSCRTCRERPVHLRRRDDREPELRGQFGLAVARGGLCAAALSEDDLAQLVQRAQAIGAVPEIEPAALARLLAYADGDARRLLNARDPVGDGAGLGLEQITDAWLLQVLGERLRRYDKAANSSTTRFQPCTKSVRGSDPDAALYWFAHARRWRRSALTWRGAWCAWRAGHRPGRSARAAHLPSMRPGLRAARQPRGRLALAEALVYLAVAAKSNAVYHLQRRQAFVKGWRGRCRCTAQRADTAHDEGARLRQDVPLCA